jgi:hypothetical protein
MRDTNSISDALVALGFDGGWAVANNQIIIWDRPEPQPTEAELIAAGWIKPEPTPEETPTE